VDYKLEVVVIPVSDVDKAKDFYQGLGWRLDADFPFNEGFRVVQLTPPGSACSIIFGSGVTSAAPGSADGPQLIVSDIEAARDGGAHHRAIRPDWQRRDGGCNGASADGYLTGALRAGKPSARLRSVSGRNTSDADTPAFASAM
jgi:catechol 2,3-dioxygenase-like lactoylglutathione lyase family enzyme